MVARANLPPLRCSICVVVLRPEQIGGHRDGHLLCLVCAARFGAAQGTCTYGNAGDEALERFDRCAFEEEPDLRYFDRPAHPSEPACAYVRVLSVRPGLRARRFVVTG